MWWLTFFRLLLIALWVGGVAVIALVEAPAKFRTPEINRNQAVAVGRIVFAALNKFELVISFLLLAITGILFLQNGLQLWQEKLALPGLGLMWLIILLQSFWLTPQLSALSRVLDLVHRNENDPRYAIMRRLHISYAALEMCKLAAGIFVLGCWHQP